MELSTDPLSIYNDCGVEYVHYYLSYVEENRDDDAALDREATSLLAAISSLQGCNDKQSAHLLVSFLEVLAPHLYRRGTK